MACDGLRASSARVDGGRMAAMLDGGEGDIVCLLNG